MNELRGPGVFGGGRRSGLEAAVRSKEHICLALEVQGYKEKNLENAAGETVPVKIARQREPSGKRCSYG